MKWHLFRQDDPNTWPQIDCPMVIHTGWLTENEPKPFQLVRWDKQNEWFKMDSCAVVMTECCYAYINYAPSGYKTSYPVICACGNCPEGYDDDGYCMDYDNNCDCRYKKEIAEYAIEVKRIWKEFE